MDFRVCTQGALRTFQLERAGPEGRLYAIFGAADGIAGSGPVAQLSQMAPATTARPHFHDVDQFHIFFGTPGSTYQRRPIPPVLVHYIDGYTPYGPVVAGKDWLDIITLRANHDHVTGYMPQDRHLLARKAGRNLKAEVDLSGAAFVRAVIEPQSDGLAAYLVTVDNDHHPVVPRSVESAGQFYCVLSGKVRAGATSAEQGSLGWLAPGSATPELSADAKCQVLVLQFPKATAQSHPRGTATGAKTPTYAF